MRTLHPSLIRPITLAGIPRIYCILNWMAAVMVIALNLNSLSWVLVGGVLSAGIAGHIFLARICSKDPKMVDIYFRSMKYQDYYPARAHPSAPAAQVRKFVKPNIQ